LIRQKSKDSNLPSFTVGTVHSLQGDEKLIAYWKYKWLSPLRENPDFSALYEEAKQKVAVRAGISAELSRMWFDRAFGESAAPRLALSA